MDISEVMLRYLDAAGPVYRPAAFVGAWPAEAETVIRTLIEQHDGAQVRATYNNWTCIYYPDGAASARRASWDTPLFAPTVDALIARLRAYYGEGK